MFIKNNVCIHIKINKPTKSFPAAYTEKHMYVWNNEQCFQKLKVLTFVTSLQGSFFNDKSVTCSEQMKSFAKEYLIYRQGNNRA